jgi:hypothetical protein
MKIFIIKSILFSVLLVIPLFFLSKKYSRAVFSLNKEKAHWILKLKSRQYDAAFIGSSRVYNCLDTRCIDSILLTKSINLGAGGASYPENYLLLDQFIKNGNSIKLLCIQVDMWGLVPAEQAYTHAFSEEKYLHLLGDDIVDSVYLKNSNPLKFYFRKYLPFFKYAEYNSIYPVDETLLGIAKNAAPYNWDVTNGSHILKGKKKNFSFDLCNNNSFENLSYSLNSFYSLEKMISYANTHKIKVVLFTTPSYIPFMKNVSFYKPSMDSIKNIVSRSGIKYYNFETLPLCIDSAYFRDFSHLNDKGAVMFSGCFADSLKNSIHE